MKQETKDQLEIIIDSNGLNAVIDALAAIACEKADHIRSNYQDEHLAKSWEKDQKRLDSIMEKIEN